MNDNVEYLSFKIKDSFSVKQVTNTENNFHFSKLEKRFIVNKYILVIKVMCKSIFYKMRKIVQVKISSNNFNLLTLYFNDCYLRKNVMENLFLNWTLSWSLSLCKETFKKIKKRLFHLITLNDLIAQYGKSRSLFQYGSGYVYPCTYFEFMDFLLPTLFKYISPE